MSEPQSPLVAIRPVLPHWMQQLDYLYSECCRQRAVLGGLGGQCCAPQVCSGGQADLPAGRRREEECRSAAYASSSKSMARRLWENRGS